jgi:protoporphyrinogen oxidase
MKVVVIGAGVIGLTTAWKLLQNNFDVVVYSKDLSPNTTSDLSGGIIFCPGVTNIEQIVRSRLDHTYHFQQSLQEFTELAKNPEKTGVELTEGVHYPNQSNFRHHHFSHFTI